MRVAFKFFAVAYSLVLLATGFGGMVMVRHVTDTLWESRVQTVEREESYALDSFSAYAEMLPGSMTETQRRQIRAQIEASLDSAIDEVQIIHCQDDALFGSYADKEGAVFFEESDGAFRMRIECCVYIHTEQYIVRLYSDFTALREQCRGLWQSYSVTILILSTAGGLVIFLLIKTITRPLQTLALSAQRIAEGDYSTRVAVNDRDPEIAELSAAFNHMASTVSETICAITEESKKRERFAADFAHEMKTPMTAIIGYAQLLEQYDLSDDERQAAAETIRRESMRLEKLSLQMLEWSVSCDGGSELKAVDLSAIAAALEDTLRIVSQRYHASYVIELQEVTVLADAVSLLSLLYNLADNAFKASQGTAIRVWSTDHAGYVTVCVQDQGRGIAPENIEKLTEPFYREDRSRSRAHGGTGLGLAIGKRIAALHGTELRFDSVLGAGTIVSFDLRKAGETDG